MTTAEFKAPTAISFDLLLNGVAIEDSVRSTVVGIRADDDFELPSMVTVELAVLENINDETSASIPKLDDDSFPVGDTLEIQLGYVEQLATVLTAEITGLEPEFFIHSQPKILLRGYDRRHRLMRSHKTRTFVEQKDSDIATLIAQEAQLSPQVEDSAITHPYLAQVNQTDLAFLQSRAKAIGYEVRVEDRDLIFRPLAYEESATVTLNFNNGLLEFCPRLTTLGQVSEVQVQGWNPAEKAPWVGQSRAGDEGGMMGGDRTGSSFVEKAFGASIGHTIRYGAMTQAEIDRMAQAYLKQRALGFISGEGICRGNPAIRAGTVLAIEGVGERFSGDYYVTSASHRYNTQGYYTHFEVKRNASKAGS